MHKLKSLASNTKVLFGNFTKNIVAYYRKNRYLLGKVTNILTMAGFAIGLIALGTLIWLYTRPIETANIKVPVSTDKPSYYPGQRVTGIFFGETFYEGEVRVLREVYCKEYKGVIAPPIGSAVGDFFSTQAKPSVLEGQNIVIGNLPDNVPVGSNCVVQFTNVYRIQTIFGVRHEEYQYYTQNFAILTKERQLQIECEAAGRTDCNIDELEERTDRTAPQTPTIQSTPESN